MSASTLWGRLFADRSVPPPEPGRTLTAAEVVGEGFVLIGARRHFYTGEVMQILRHRDLQPQPLPPAK